MLSFFRFLFPVQFTDEYRKYLEEEFRKKWTTNPEDLINEIDKIWLIISCDFEVTSYLENHFEKRPPASDDPEMRQHQYFRALFPEESHPSSWDRHSTMHWQGTILHLIAHEGSAQEMRVLLGTQYGKDYINLKADTHDETPLHWAIKDDNLLRAAEKIVLLVNEGADLQAKQTGRAGKYSALELLNKNLQLKVEVEKKVLEITQGKSNDINFIYRKNLAISLKSNNESGLRKSNNTNSYASSFAAWYGESDAQREARYAEIRKAKEQLEHLKQLLSPQEYEIFYWDVVLYQDLSENRRTIDKKYKEEQSKLLSSNNKKAELDSKLTDLHQNHREQQVQLEDSHDAKTSPAITDQPVQTLAQPSENKETDENGKELEKHSQQEEEEIKKARKMLKEVKAILSPDKFKEFRVLFPNVADPGDRQMIMSLCQQILKQKEDEEITTAQKKLKTMKGGLEDSEFKEFYKSVKNYKTDPQARKEIDAEFNRLRPKLKYLQEKEAALSQANNLWQSSTSPREPSSVTPTLSPK